MNLTQKKQRQKNKQNTSLSNIEMPKRLASRSKDYSNKFDQSISGSKNQKINDQSTYVQSSQSGSKANTTDLKSSPYKRQKNNDNHEVYSKCKSQASFSRQKIYHNENYSKQKISINRLLETKGCQRHAPLFQGQTSLFNPQTKSNIPYQIYHEKTLQSKSLCVSKELKFERLIEDLRMKHLNRFELKINKQNEQIKSTCIFIPNFHENIMPNPQIHQKLYEQSKFIKEKLTNYDQTKITNQNNLLQRFKSQSKQRYSQNKKKWEKFLNNEKHKETFSHPIFQRVDIIERNKKQLLQKLQIKYHQQTQKKTISSQKQAHLVKRLVDDYRIKRDQNMRISKQKEKQKFNNEHTFSPTLNSNQLYQPSKNIENKPLKQQVYTFKPQINTMSHIITLKIRQLRKDNQSNQCLYEGYMERKINKIQKIQQQHFKEYTFQPEINQISKQLLYNKSQDFKRPQHKCSLPESIILRQKQSTFQPKINLQSKCMNSQQKYQVVIKNKEKSKQKTDKIQNYNQFKQLEECTFQPKTISTTSEWKKWKQNYLKTSRMIKLQKDPSIFLDQKQNNLIKAHKQNYQTDNLNTQQNNQLLKEQQNYKYRQNTYRNKQKIPSQVKGLLGFLKNCEKAQQHKQIQQKRMQQIFNNQKKYDQRIKKQKNKNL